MLNKSKKILLLTICCFVMALFVLMAKPLVFTKKKCPRDIPVPVENTIMTTAYVEQVAADAYFWAWPMVNIQSRFKMFSNLPGPGLLGGIAPVAPVNTLSMLQNYIDPSERSVACPNQDVIYGFGLLDLSKEPIVVQVPEIKNRFWIYQVGNQRTEGFAEFGSIYGTKSGFYLLAKNDWNGKIPSGISGIFRSDTDIGYIIPRLFTEDSQTDKDIVRKITSEILIYPLSKFDGKMKKFDWSKLKTFPAGDSSKGETSWVNPATALADIESVLNTVPPMFGEEAIYANFKSVIAAAKRDKNLANAFLRGATRAEKEMVVPLLQFRNVGYKVANNWMTTKNGAKFGVDYLSRTAAARANIFVNTPIETKYFTTDFDRDNKRLNGSNNYIITFAKGQLPPAKGFWSLTVYDKYHFFVPNIKNRFSLGTKNKNLVYNADGSLTLYLQTTSPGKDKEVNWLPTPKDDFSLMIRGYQPEEVLLNDGWTPPAVMKK